MLSDYLGQNECPFNLYIFIKILLFKLLWNLFTNSFRKVERFSRWQLNTFKSFLNEIIYFEVISSEHAQYKQHPRQFIIIYFMMWDLLLYFLLLISIYPFSQHELSFFWKLLQWNHFWKQQFCHRRAAAILLKTQTILWIAGGRIPQENTFITGLVFHVSCPVDRSSSNSQAPPKL